MALDYQQLVDEISAVLQAPATLEDRDFRLVAFGVQETREGDEEAEEALLDPVRTRSILRRRSSAAVRAWFEGFGITRATAPLRIPPDPAAGVLHGRICLPVRHGGIVHGYVWLLDDGHLTDLVLGGPGVPPDPRVEQAMESAYRIGELMAAQAGGGAELAGLLRALLTAQARNRPEAAAALREALRLPAGRPYALVVVLPWGERSQSAVSGQPGLLAACRLTTALGRGEAGAGPGDGRPDAAFPAGGEEDLLAALVRLRTSGSAGPADTVAEHLLGAPRAASGTGPAGPADGAGGAGGPGAAGVADVRSDLAALPAAFGEAVAAARAARAEPSLGPVAHWADLGPYRALTALPPGPPDAAVTELLRPAHRELARTVEVFLDLAGAAGRTAAELGVHRQTLYYRLHRAEQLTGLDLDSGGDRLLLHLELKRARLARGGGS
ncbi:PucR family transcriptional regulator [Streptomyces sp. NPDC059740]|uniref:PucR family transcriptional regulator n=1 Tax=Streptomyces sp. NPDC059740 TaxID=3346926 RepID=UPI00364ABDF5